MSRELRKTDSGYTIHETVSDEENAVSPTFRSKEEIKEWLMVLGVSEKAASKFVELEFCPSGMLVNGKFFKNYECCGFL